MAMSYNGFLALGKETTWGVRVARTRFMRFLSAQFNHNPNWIVSNDSQSRYMTQAFPGKYEHGLTATLELRADAIGEILRSLFWVDPDTSQVGILAYEHEFIPADSETTPEVKSYTPELRYGTSGKAEVGAGGFVNQATFSWDDGIATVAIEMPSKEPLLADPTGSPSFTNVAPFLFSGLTMVTNPDTEDAVERKIRSGSLTINNNAIMTPESGSRFISKPEAGAFTAELSFSQRMVDFQDLKDMWSTEGVDNEITDICEAPRRPTRFKFTGCEIETVDGDPIAMTADATSNTAEDVAHGLVDGTKVKFASSGTVPAPLVADTTYYVVNATDDDFQVAATKDGVFIDLTSAGTGSITYTVITTHYFELEFDMPALVVMQPQFPMSGKDEIVESLTLQAMYDDISAKAISARLKNTVASY